MNKVAIKVPTIRWLVRSDMPSVLEIEKTNSGFTNPVGGMWTEKDFLSVLRGKSNIGMVAIEVDRVIGFCIYGLIANTIHVYNLGVKKEFENRGVGDLLVDKLKSKLCEKRSFLDFDIRETNLRAQLFLKHHGFRAINIVKNWFEKPHKEDAYKFRFERKKI